MVTAQPTPPPALVDVPVTGKLHAFTAVASLSYRALGDPGRRLAVLCELSEADSLTRDAFLLLVLQNPPPIAFDLLHPHRWDNLFTYDERVFAWLGGGAAAARHLDKGWPFGGPTPSAIVKRIPAHVAAEPRWASLVATYLQASRNLDAAAFTAVAVPLLAAAPAEEIRHALARLFAAPALLRAGLGGSAAQRLARGLTTARARRQLGGRLFAADLVPQLARVAAKPPSDARDLAEALLRVIVEGAPASDPAALERLAPLFAPAVAAANPALVGWALRSYPGFATKRLLARAPGWRAVLTALRARAHGLRPAVDAILAR